MALQRCNGSPGFSDSCLQVRCISFFNLTMIYRFISSNSGKANLLTIENSKPVSDTAVAIKLVKY